MISLLNNEIYRLIDTLDVSFNAGGWLRNVRIEVLESINNPLTFRGKILLDNTFNIYPSQLNTDDDGNDLHKIHSAENIATDISSNLPIASFLIEGHKKTSKEEFIKEILPVVEEYLKGII